MADLRTFVPSLLVGVLAYLFCVRALFSVLLKNHALWMKERGMNTTLKTGFISTDPKLYRLIYSREDLKNPYVARLKRNIWLLTALLIWYAGYVIYLKMQGRI